MKLDAAGTTIAIADKFGDVYSLPVLFTPIEIPAGEEEPKHEPKLGHVSVVTDLVLTENKEIVTCDRDEHVRVSRWPEGYDIVAFLLGHTRLATSSSARIQADLLQLCLCLIARTRTSSQRRRRSRYLCVGHVDARQAESSRSC